MTSRRSTRRRTGGRAGLIGALLALGLVTALVAAAATASFLDGGSGGRAPIGAATKADLASPELEDATPPPARSVLRVTGGASPTSPGSTIAADGSDPMAATDDSALDGSAATTSTTSDPSSASTGSTAPGSGSSQPGPAGGSSRATTTTLTPAPIELADPDARFVTLPPGSALPSGAECAARVRPTPENVPENRSRNQTRGGPVRGTYLSGNPSIGANDYEARIDGDFIGSTDEVIQWAACKWGFDEDILRAQVYAESSWYAGKLGDCGEATVPETGGCASVGLIQVRSAESGATHHPGVYPQAWQSSALNLDYGLAVQRLCFEGLESWLGQTGPYGAGDQWNCMGRWFSGSWADAGSADYQAKVRDILARRPWETWVGCRDWQTNNHCGG